MVPHKNTISGYKRERVGNYVVLLSPHFEVRSQQRDINFIFIRKHLSKKIREYIIHYNNLKIHKDKRVTFKTQISDDRILTVIAAINNRKMTFITTYTTWYSDKKYMNLKLMET